MTEKERNRIIIAYEDTINNHPILGMCRRHEAILEEEKFKFVEIVWKYEVLISENYKEYADVLVKAVSDALDYVGKKGEENTQTDEGKDKLFTHLINMMIKQRMYQEKQKETPGGVTGREISKHKQYVQKLKEISKLNPNKSFDELVEILAYIKTVTTDYVMEVLRNGPVIIDSEIKNKDGESISIFDNIGTMDKYFESNDDSRDEMSSIKEAYALLGSRTNKDVIKGMLTMYVAKELKKKHRTFMSPFPFIEKRVMKDMLTKNINFDLVERESGVKLNFCFIDKELLCDLLKEYALVEALHYCLRQEPTFLQAIHTDDGKQNYCCPSCGRGKNENGLTKISKGKISKGRIYPCYICEVCKANGRDSYDVFELYAIKYGIDYSEVNIYKSFRRKGELSKIFTSLCKYFELISNDEERVVLSNGVNKKKKQIEDAEEIIAVSLYEKQGIAAYYNVAESSRSRTWGEYTKILAKVCNIDLPQKERHVQENIRE